MKNLFSIFILFLGISLFGQIDSLDIDGVSELDEVIIRESRIQVPFSQATRDIQLITKKDIENMPVKSVNEVLAYISGVDIRQRGPFGTQADIAIDGGTSEQTLVLVNGVKMLDVQTAHNMMNIPVPLNAVEHIEVLRGAAARVYGINALTGAINIVTRQEKYSSVIADFKAGSSFKNKEEGDGSGIYGGWAGELTGLWGSEKHNQLLSVSYADYNGQRYNSDSENAKLFYTGDYRFDAQNRIQLMAGYARSRFGANGFYAAPGDINSEELVKSSIFSLSSSHKWGAFTLSPRISNRYGEDDYRYFKDDWSKARSLHYANALMMEVGGSLKTKIGTIGAGWESRFERINSSNIGDHNRDNHGVFAELRTDLSKKLKTTAGVYANYNTDYGWQLYPGLDMSYQLSNSWKLFAGVGSAQRIPSFTDLYLNQLPGNVGNPLVEPEDAWNYEANIQYKKGNFQFRTGYFYRNISGFIDWVRPDETEPYTPMNFNKNRMQGFFGRIQQHFQLGNNQSLGYHISYNHLSPTVKSLPDLQSKYVLESLKHQLIAGVNWQIHSFTIQMENRYQQRELGKAYHITDFRMNWRLNDFLIYTDITNLFNASYTEAGAVPMPTRWFGIGVRYEWRKAMD